MHAHEKTKIVRFASGERPSRQLTQNCEQTVADVQRSDIKGNALTHGGHCAIREPVRSAPAPAPAAAAAAAVLPAAACRGVARRSVCCGGAVRY